MFSFCKLFHWFLLWTFLSWVNSSRCESQMVVPASPFPWSFQVILLLLSRIGQINSNWFLLFSPLINQYFILCAFAVFKIFHLIYIEAIPQQNHPHTTSSTSSLLIISLYFLPEPLSSAHRDIYILVMTGEQQTDLACPSFFILPLYLREFLSHGFCQCRPVLPVWYQWSYPSGFVKWTLISIHILKWSEN